MSDADDITSDYWWRREIVTDELDEACDAIAVGLGIARSAVGTKGDTNHRRGSHRSQEWILNSPWCTNRTYTVQKGLTADQLRHIAGVDIIPGEWGTTANRQKCYEITARVVAEMKAGRLDIVRECYGPAADLRTVTGWNNIENRVASADSSHLDHPHLGLDRTKLRDRAALSRLVAVILGEVMTLSAIDAEVMAWRVADMATGTGEATGGPRKGEPVFVVKALKELLVAARADEARDVAATAAIQALATAGGVDAAPVLAAVDRVGTELGGRIGQLEAALAAAEAERDELQVRLAAALAPADN